MTFTVSRLMYIPATVSSTSPNHHRPRSLSPSAKALLAASAAMLMVWHVDAQVSERGTFQQSVNIEAPTFHDLTPNIGLIYDSNGLDGPVGMGWTLIAGSQITRSSAASGAPRYDASDHLSLDGLEIRPCAPLQNNISCTTGGTHATRVETFYRLIGDPSSNTWTVWHPDGTRYVHGSHSVTRHHRSAR